MKTIKAIFRRNQTQSDLESYGDVEINYDTKQLKFKGKEQSLTKKEYDILVKSIKRVLQKAIKAGGTSISDFKNLDGGVGYFSQKLKIYGLDECGICGKKTYNITIAGRSSYYCKKCQR